MNNSLRSLMLIFMLAFALDGAAQNHPAGKTKKGTTAVAAATCQDPSLACTGAAPLGGSYCLRGSIHVRGLDSKSTLWAMNETVTLTPSTEATTCKTQTIFSSEDSLFVRINQSQQLKIGLFLKLANKFLQGDLKKCTLSTEQETLCLRIDDTDFDYYVLLIDMNVNNSPMNKWYRIEAFPHAGSAGDTPACHAERPDAVPGVAGAKDNWVLVNAAGSCPGEPARSARPLPREAHQGGGGEPFP